MKMKNAYPNPMKAYDVLDNAFDYFDGRLFRSELRPCLITVQRRRSACGFFAPARFRSHDETDIADEIGLDPRYWGPPRTDIDNLAVLVHEMCHLWQFHYGKPGRGGYHNREYARKMFEVGLVTSNTGEPEGRPTGRSMSHYVTAGGPFDRVCAELLSSGFVIPYHEIMAQSEEDHRRQRSRAESKTNYVCPCGQARVWGKPGLKLACRPCDAELEAAGRQRRQRPGAVT
jgi:predicted SprT family Zn-dependent metalloprotease